MLIFLDTEFTGLEQRNPGLISIGLVREDGESFYAELPSMDYEQRASYWVRENVLPLLWAGSYRMPAWEMAEKLVHWIEAIDDRVMAITDSPEYDFEFVKALLLPVWPRNLAKACMRFDSYAMGPNGQEWLEAVMAEYHDNEQRPEHHALHDAHSLRLGMMAALDAGWRPPR